MKFPISDIVQERGKFANEHVCAFLVGDAKSIAPDAIDVMPIVTGAFTLKCFFDKGFCALNDLLRVHNPFKPVRHSIFMVYEPREDSFLLREFVYKHAKGRVLDMGTGSGIQAAAAAGCKKVTEVIAADIDPRAIEYAKKHQSSKKNINYVLTDLFTKLNPKKYHHYFDTIIFNAPYLPNDPKSRDFALDGGKQGHETIERFLERLHTYLKPDGECLLVFSSITPHMPGLIEKYLFAGKELGRKHQFFEDIFVYLVKKSKTLKELEKKDITDISYFTKGKRGYIYTGKYRTKKVAIKVKNPKSTAEGTIVNEARMLKIVNEHDLGPKYLFHSLQFIVYEFVEGELLQDLIDSPKFPAICKEVFKQCFTLDQLGINKKEMLRPRKHVIVKGKKVTMIDWERAQKVKDPHNVTQFCQFMRTFEKGDKEQWTIIAKEYKKDPSKKVLERILKMI